MWDVKDEKVRYWGMKRGWWGGEGVGRRYLELPLEPGVLTPHLWGSQKENHHVRQNRNHLGAGPYCGSRWLQGLWACDHPKAKLVCHWEMTSYTSSFLKSLMWPRLWDQSPHTTFSSNFTQEHRFTLSLLTRHLRSFSFRDTMTIIHLNTHSTVPSSFKSLLN